MKRRIHQLVVILIFIAIACQELEGPAGLNSLINISSEGPGANCTSSGLKIETGMDKNKNGLLERDEITITKYLCNGNPGKNGEPGLAGLKSLINVTPEPAGSKCNTGGHRVDTGIDSNANNVLDPEEIQSTKYICNGINGVKSLISIGIELPGTNCSAGGYKIQSGLDNNNNNILDTGEVSTTKYLCHGESGDLNKTPDYTLTVHGKDNCFLLNNSVAVGTSISPGTYSVQVTGNAFFAPDASHKKVFIRYSGADDDHLEILTIGATRSLSFRSGSLYAFFADWQSVSDNSGQVNIVYGSSSLPVHGKNNCILLDNSVAAKASIPSGIYKVKVTGNAFFSPNATHYSVFMRYAGADDDQLDMLAIGGEKILNLRNGNGFYAFFADWTSIADNSGTITIEFYKL